MMGLSVQEVSASALILAGILFLFAGSLGILRLPDFYTRSHASSKIDTLGMLLVMAGLIVFEGLTLNSLKLGFIFIFIAFANPIGSHALARAAMADGLKPLLFGRAQSKANPTGPKDRIASGDRSADGSDKP